MQIIKTELLGCYLLKPTVFTDQRGSFTKTYHDQIFSEHGFNTHWCEEYFSVSNKNVIRGMHFQLPPYDHEKLVYCVYGAVMDVIIDLRLTSPTYKKYVSIELSSTNSNMLYIPKGCAHGFKALENNTIMMYKVSTVYNQDADCGVMWNSCNIDWQLKVDEIPTVSTRDMSFVKFEEFETPFK